MKIILNNIPEEGLNLQFHKDSDWFRNLLPKKEKSDFSLRDVDVSCIAKRIRENVFIDGTLETVVASHCCRCLEITQLPVKSIIQIYLCSGERQGMRKKRNLHRKTSNTGIIRTM